MELLAKLESHMVAEMRQDQSLTHQQIQTLEILAKPVLELEGMISDELEQNPVLEVDEFDTDSGSTEKDDALLDRILRLESEKRYIPSNQQSWSSDDDERRRYYMETVAYEPTLHELLLQQVRMMDLNPIVLGCCEVVISGFDDDGYLESHPADLAMAAGATLEQISEAVKIVQQLEPAGVGARDLRERLLLQLERQGKGKDLAARIVSDHLQDVAGNRLPRISRALRVPLSELESALSEIRGLSPRLFLGTVTPDRYVYPEVFVQEENGRLRASVNNRHLPNLSISQHYRKLLTDPDTSSEARSYIKGKIRGAVFLINTILQRQTTIERISQSIVDVQQDFFRHGMDHLKPLTMARVAEDVGVHETTVSRAVAGKYLRCRYGLFPIRMFFCAGCRSEGGQSVSNVAIKNTLRRLINDEDVYTPLSDSQIAQQLKDQGLKVARRTVAKYRESLSIPPCHQRRKYRIAQ